jgi:hypothetical protein
LSSEFALAAGEFYRDLLVLCAINLRRLQTLDEIDCLHDALLEIGDARLGVGEGQQFGTGQAPTRIGGMAGRLSHLPH